MAIVDDLEQGWQSRIQTDCPEQSEASIASIVAWLLGEERDRFDALDRSQLAIAKQAMDYRYRICYSAIWGFPRQKATTNLSNA